MDGVSTGHQSIAIDNFAALLQLLTSGEQNLHYYMAQHHAETMLTACRRHNGAFYASAYFDGRGFQPDDQAGLWSRGQSWAMLGLTRAAALWGEPYLTHAKTACEYWQHSRPDSLPPNRIGQSVSCDDPSAVVIASIAMLSLARLQPDGEYWRVYAHRQISAIIRSQYFIGFKQDAGYSKSQHNSSTGVFWGCCYKTRQSEEELVESVWGIFS